MKKKLIYLIIIGVCLILLVLIFQNDGEKFVTKTMTSNLFKLEVETPTFLEVGDNLVAEGKIKYIGDEEIELAFGEAVLFLEKDGYLIGPKEETNDPLTDITLKPDEIISIKEKFKLEKVGTYHLSLQVSFSGVPYIENREIQGGTITINEKDKNSVRWDMNSIEIKVIE